MAESEFLDSGEQSMVGYQPQSPGSVYKVSKIKLNRQALVTAIVLSCWDNIMGPRIEHVWQVTGYKDVHNDTGTDVDKEYMNSETYKYVGTHTLNGEICRDLSSSTIDTKFYMLKNRHIIVLAFIFGAVSKSGLGVHSLGIIMPDDSLQTYLNWSGLIEVHMMETIQRFRVYREKNSRTAIRTTSDEILTLLEALSSLSENGLSEKIQVLFSKSNLLDETSTVLKKKEFLRHAITSHIITCGHTIVIGDSIPEINQMISTLAMFNSPRERTCSTYLKEDTSSQLYILYPNLFLQGILLPSMYQPTAKDILTCQYPTTIVDMCKNTVRQSLSYNDHLLRKYELLKQDLASLYQTESTIRELYPPDQLLCPLEYSESLITKLLQEISHLATQEGPCAEYVDNFNRLLKRMALTLIRAVDREQTNMKSNQKLNVKKIRQDLGWTLEGDFRMVLATAEKMKPGIFTVIMGDRKVQADALINQIENV